MGRSLHQSDFLVLEFGLTGVVVLRSFVPWSDTSRTRKTSILSSSARPQCHSMSTQILKKRCIKKTSSTAVHSHLTECFLKNQSKKACFFVKSQVQNRNDSFHFSSDFKTSNSLLKQGLISRSKSK